MNSITTPKGGQTKGTLTLASALLLTGSTLVFGGLSATSASAQSACAEYTIVRGDTLSQIAQRAEVRGGYQALFSANSTVLRNPNVVEIGQVLQIPCADGSLPGAGSSRQAATPASVQSVPETTMPDRALRIVTASDYAPFTDENLEGGGALTRIVDRAVSLGNPDQAYDLYFVNDWGSHLESLLPTQAVDMAFPWYRPDCSKVENLSEASAYRCTAFNHSDPLYDALVGYYTLAGGQYSGATTYEELMGARLCRPEAWFTFDLEAERLMPPNVELTRTVAQNGCWQMLLDGEVDIVTLDALPAEEDYRTLGIEDQVVNLENLSSKQTLHVFVSKDNAFANEALPIINAGLEQMRLSGEWFEIVQKGILETMEN